MKNQVAHTNAGFRAIAGGARPAVGRVRNAYPWLCGDLSTGRPMATATVITESKFHHRWPRDLSP